jgi:hypothetical protein
MQANRHSSALLAFRLVSRSIGDFGVTQFCQRRRLDSSGGRTGRTADSAARKGRARRTPSPDIPAQANRETPRPPSRLYLERPTKQRWMTERELADRPRLISLGRLRVIDRNALGRSRRSATVGVTTKFPESVGSSYPSAAARAPRPAAVAAAAPPALSAAAAAASAAGLTGGRARATQAHPELRPMSNSTVGVENASIPPSAVTTAARTAAITPPAIVSNVTTRIACPTGWHAAK